MGIWDDARLVVCHEFYLNDVRVKPSRLSRLQILRGPVCVCTWRSIATSRARPIAIRPATFTDETEQSSILRSMCHTGRSQHELGFDLAAARLLAAWERGEPCLYELTVSLARRRGCA